LKFNDSFVVGPISYKQEFGKLQIEDAVEEEEEDDETVDLFE
jgi:hypothetical protein